MYSYLTLPLVFDLCFVDSLRKKRDLIVKLESEGWPYEELRERARPNLPDARWVRRVQHPQRLLRGGSARHLDPHGTAKVRVVVNPK